MNRLKTILADDHPIFLKGLEETLKNNKQVPMEIIGTYRSGRTLLEKLPAESCDILILDLSLKDFDGLEVIKGLRNKVLPLNIIVLSRFKDVKMIRSALQMGADAYLLKTGDPAELFIAVKKVRHKETYIGQGIKLVEDRNGNGLKSFEDKFIKKYYLTKREIQILRLITQALSNKEIAKELFISDQTVSVHRKNIMRKIGVSNTAGLIKMAYDYCLV